eukprot:TRINITY_DN5106_c0_g1_i3.p2 TRINITY_DN5106_c0_g1~~TRINITY_DN5106_c0_g1_i3.p2  ORF type:complete len:134 (+),score=19.76 TRINITY_DN5106_c0_g1_i3:485-886(+)
MTGCPLAREELHKALEESEMADAALLVLANKQDLPKAVRKDEMERLLNLEDVKDRRWFVQEADARSRYDRAGMSENFEDQSSCAWSGPRRNVLAVLVFRESFWCGRRLLVAGSRSTTASLDRGAHLQHGQGGH